MFTLGWLYVACAFKNWVNVISLMLSDEKDEIPAGISDIYVSWLIRRMRSPFCTLVIPEIYGIVRSSFLNA